MRVREARARLRLELVAREVLGLERERLGEVRVEVGPGLARDAVDEVERDVVESGVTERANGPPDVVGRRLAARAPRAVAAGSSARRARRASRRSLARSAASAGVTVSGFASTVTSSASGSALEQPLELAGSRERRRAAAEEDRLDVGREDVPLELELREQRVDVRRVLVAPPDDGDEVAVAAAVRAERQVDVQVTDAAHERFRSESRLSTARNASCGTSTPPTCFIRFLPFFCFSSSLRLRVMSPP